MFRTETGKMSNPKHLNIKFEQMFKFMLRAMDIIQFHPYMKKDIKWACKLLFIYVTCLVVICVIVYSIIFRDLKVKDITQACSNGVICLIFCVITLQYCIMFYYQKLIQNMIEIMNNDYEKAEEYTAEEKHVILEYVEIGKSIINIWRKITYCGGGLFITRPIFVMVYYAVFSEFKPVHLYEMVYPSPMEELKDTFSVYCILYVVFILFTCCTMFTLLGFQPLGPIFMVHACGQLEVARTRIMKIFQDDNSAEEIIVKLKHIAGSLKNIYRYFVIVIVVLLHTNINFYVLFFILR